MACGCVVAGFTGGGAKEFMIDEQTALVSSDGDTDSAAAQVIRILVDEKLRNSLRAEGMKIAKTYNSEKTKTALQNYFANFRVPEN